tara:strand:+ start:316 stop:432 length:117 start_codon:yes stop_codon:yes gene_type:complete
MSRLEDLTNAKEHFETLEGEIYDHVKENIQAEIDEING